MPGTHNELLRRKGGVYSQMWEAQNGEVNHIIVVVVLTFPTLSYITLPYCNQLKHDRTYHIPTLPYPNTTLP